MAIDVSLCGVDSLLMSTLVRAEKLPLDVPQGGSAVALISVWALCHQVGTWSDEVAAVVGDAATASAPSTAMRVAIPARESFMGDTLRESVTLRRRAKS